MAHARAKLTVLGRQLLVDRVLMDGWKPADAAKAMGVSRQTAYKWLRRFRDEGPAGLIDRTSAPRRCPHRLSRGGGDIVAARLKLSMAHTVWPMAGGPFDDLWGLASGRHLPPQLHRPAHPHRRPLRAERPGELLHVDVKKLGRIREGGGWRFLGLERRPGGSQDEPRRIRLPPRGDRRSLPGGLRPGIARREGCDLRRVLADAVAFFAAHGVGSSGHDRQRHELPALEGLSKTLETLGIAHGARELPAPDQRQSRDDSTAPCSRSSPTRTLPRMPTAQLPSGPGSTPTIAHDLIRRSEGLPRYSVWSTTLTGITPRRLGCPRRPRPRFSGDRVSGVPRSRRPGVPVQLVVGLYTH